MSEPEPHSTPNDNTAALPVGTRLGEYELRSVIGVGGFGIVYLAFDHALEREVAIKEYMPATLATRSCSIDVAPLSQAVTDNFETGLRSFVNEGRMLAHFDSPSLLKVHRYWEANGTAYMTMPLYRGRTLAAVRAAMTTAPDEAAARALLMPLLSALDLLHRESIYHRDIAPDNILIEAGNQPVLLDFGAARRVVGETSRALTAIVKPAYAPIEQYGETASVKQGAWTDLYALGATMHFYLLGQAPPPSTSRAVHDEMVPLAERDLPGCSRTFLRTIDWMLAPRPADRPQSVAQLLQVLEGRAELPALGSVRTEAAAGVGVDIPIDIVPPPPPPPPPPPAPPVTSASSAASGSALRWALPAAALLLLLLAAGWWLWPRKLPPPPPPAPIVVAPVPAPATAPAPVPTVPPTEPVATAPVPAPAAASRAAAPVPRTPPPEVARAAAPAASARRPKPPPAASEVMPPPPQAAPLATGRPAEAAAASAPVRPARAEPASAAAVAKGPRETCGRRIFVALVNCMNRECAKPENRRLPECSLYRPPD